jgi:23S rRNA (cytidine1920-2'-O)/16S rRNA (cytidine1409-2'-O)-methyltransferase
MARLTLLELLKARFPGKSEAELRSAILRGHVEAAGRKLLKPGALFSADTAPTVRDPPRFVSRGGEKLAHALSLWRLEAQGLTWLDAGSSTGGFTDCLLQAGAERVHAVDVGWNQIDWRLRTDPRVLLRERTNVMSLSPGELVPPPHMAVADLSFRSLRGAASRILGLTTEKRGVFLVKPQFEWEDPSPAFRGVVKEAGAWKEILLALAADLSAEGVEVESAAESPIRGRRGNREFLFLLRLSPGGGGQDSAGRVRGLFGE